MTPNDRVRTRWIIVLLVTAFVSGGSAEPSDVIQTWTGQSELGYMRVELLTPDAKEPRKARLVVKCATLPSVFIHVGQVVSLPDDIQSSSRVDLLFVASSEDMAKNARCGSPILATISLDGTLHLYAVGPCVFRIRPNLKPI